MSSLTCVPVVSSKSFHTQTRNLAAGCIYELIRLLLFVNKYSKNNNNNREVFK